MDDPPIRDVSDTAFWIAHLRAMENERPDALFRDPFAARLAGERGRRIAASLPGKRLIAWSVALRTRIIDDFIRMAVAEGTDTVLNIGAGLDARPYRMDLPASLRWIEADYPRITEYKETLLAGEAPVCALERVRIDLADRPARRALFASVDASTGRMLVLAEGVLPYLSVEEGAALAEDVRAMRRACCWVVDYFSQASMKYRRGSAMARGMRNAPFRFDPGDLFRFFREHGWQAREVRYFVEESEKLRRTPAFPWYLKLAWGLWSPLLPRERRDALRRFAGYMLLEPLSPHPAR
jgi:methyltransferase (TIGR00027 family)